MILMKSTNSDLIISPSHPAEGSQARAIEGALGPTERQVGHTLDKPRLRRHPQLAKNKTLAEVRTLVETQLPPEYRAKFSWRQLAGLLRRAAYGEQDVAAVISDALRIVLQLEGVPCR